MILYHMTPEKNEVSILRDGLLAGKERALGSSSEQEEYGDAIFLARSIEEARLQLDLFGGDEPGARVRYWTIFEVRLPNDWPLEEDKDGYLFTRRAIPPGRLRIAFRDRDLYKKLRDTFH